MTLLRAIGLLGGAVLAMATWGAGPGTANEPAFTLEGRIEQGALLHGRITPGSRLDLAGEAVPVAPDGRFVIGLDRDAPAQVTVRVRATDGATDSRVLDVAPRDWAIQRIDGLPPAKVTPDPALAERLAAERARILAVRDRRTMTTDWAEGFVWPVEGRISGVFGSQRILNGQARAPHAGVDVAAPEGTPVGAAAPGTVVLADADQYLTGGTVLIDHGMGVTSVYAHLASITVDLGQRVAAGEPIGTVGATGRATGPHLHWGLSWGRARLDPARLVGPMPDPVSEPAVP